MVDADGRRRRAIAPEGDPAFSGRGRLLALEGEKGIVVRRFDGTKVGPKITRGFDVMPAWAPSGRRLVFARQIYACEWNFWEEVNYDYVGSPCPAKLYTVGRDGRDLRLLAERGWSPASSVRREIAYVGPDHAIWVSDPRGINLRQVVAYGGYPDWSPDGERLSFATSAGLFVVNRDGSGARRLQGAGRNVHSPSGRRTVERSRS